MKKTFILGAMFICFAIASYIAEEKVVAKGGLVPDGENPDFVVFATGEVGGHIEPCG